jgi:hypothetical protein
MSLSKHPNVLRVRGSWLDEHKLHIALRLMNAGSAADVMQYAWPGGMEEEVVRCILKQALEGLNYLHVNGFIHRDIKAANLLIDDDGTVLLGDLGVAAPLNDEDHTHVHENGTAKSPRIVVFDKDVNVAPRRSRVGKRRSFVGTVCYSIRVGGIICPVNAHRSSVSHAGWRQNSFLAFSMTLVRISGLSASLPSNWRRGVPHGLESLLVLCFCRSCKGHHQPSIAKAACTNIPGRLRKSSSVALRKIHRSGSRLPVIYMYFPRDPDSALFVQAHSGATPPNPFFQERKETLIPRWGHTP